MDDYWINSFERDIQGMAGTIWMKAAQGKNKSAVQARVVFIIKQYVSIEWNSYYLETCVVLLQGISYMLDGNSSEEA